MRALAVRDLGIDGTAALVRTPIGEAEIRTPLPGTANLSNVLAAAAVAIRFDIPLDDIVERAAALKPVARRGEITRIGTLTIVDDSYNSNPSALSRALAMVAGRAATRGASPSSARCSSSARPGPCCIASAGRSGARRA